MKHDRDESEARIVGAASSRTQARGAAAEALVARFLAQRGLAVVARNVRCRGGEVDLVCLDGGTLVFVEVRLRANSRFGGAAASITPAKQRRVVTAARWWLAGAGRHHATRPCRFDAALLASLDEASIEWLRGAFDSGDS